MMATQVKKAAPVAVRQGLSRGRSRQVVARPVPCHRPLERGPGVEDCEDDAGEEDPAEEGVRQDSVAEHVDLERWHQPQGADQPPEVPVGLGAVRAEPRLERTVLPDRVDLHKSPEQKQHAGDGEQQAGRAQRVARPQGGSDDVVLPVSGPPELRVLLAHDDRQVRADQGRQEGRQQQDVGDEQAGFEARGAGELAAPDQEREVCADEGDRQRDAVADREPHPGEQIVGERVAGEALEDREHEQRQPDHPVDVARLAKGPGEEDAHQVHDDRGDEDERRPVVGLAD